MGYWTVMAWLMLYLFGFMGLIAFVPDDVGDAVGSAIILAWIILVPLAFLVHRELKETRKRSNSRS